MNPVVESSEDPGRQPGTRRDDERGGDGRAVDTVQVLDGTLVKMMAWAASQLAASTDRTCR
jgi:hypothetical protein